MLSLLALPDATAVASLGVAAAVGVLVVMSLVMVLLALGGRR